MAPSPENGSEPKAPDKREHNVIEGVPSVASNQGTDTQTTAEQSSTIPGQIADQQENKARLSGLDEGQLKALLDEAITYKRPKDREGKSPLFQELLLQAEKKGEEQVPGPPGPRKVLRSERNHHRPPISERPTHGGSLQDLAESELFDPSFNYNPRENYHSRKNTGTKKKTVSVSARQREGGSLPSNVNTSSTYNYERYFLDDAKRKLRESNLHADKYIKDRERRSEEKTLRTERKSESDKRVEKQRPERERKSESDRSKQEKINLETNLAESEIPEAAASSSPYIPNPDYSLDPKGTASESQALLEHDSLADEKRYEKIETRRHRFYEQEEGTELEIITPKIPRVNYTTRAELEVNMENGNRGAMYGRTQGVPADTGLPFALLESNTLQLGGTYPSVKCIVGGEKTITELRPPQRQIAMLNIPASGNWLSTNSSMASGLNRDETKKSLDENGNAVQAFNSSLTSGQSVKGKRDKPKQKKSDRNVKVLKAEEVAGHRTETDINLILKFIENIEIPKKNGTINKVHKHNLKGEQNIGHKSDIDEKTNKKRVDRKKENKNGSKNMKKSNSLEELSCSKLEDLTETSQNETVLRNKKKQISSVSNDRRSWGEEICYLDGSNTQEQTNKKDKKYVSEIVANTAHASEPVSIVSIEPSTANSIEASEFHVVTKKKKAKKRHSPNLFSDENRNKNGMPRDSYYNKNKYGVPNFSNEHDLYLNKFSSPEHRRKSASSMPPSDKSDSSDLDSVHSLPVESTSMKLSLQQVSSSSGGTPQASYADIARMANVVPGCMSLIDKNQSEKCLSAGMHDKWPCVSSKPPLLSISPPVCNDFSGGGSTCSSTLSCKSQCSVKMSLNNYNFPDLIESCHYYTEQTKKEETKQSNEIKKSNSVKIEKLENNKNKLSKSKSVENESVNNFTEQYPALNKTEWINTKNTKSNNILSAVDNNNKKSKQNKAEIKTKSLRNTVIENDNVNDDNRTENNNKSKKQTKSQLNQIDRNINEKQNNNRNKKQLITMNIKHYENKNLQHVNDSTDLQSVLKKPDTKNNLLNTSESNGTNVNSKLNNSDGFRPPVIILDDEVDNDNITPMDDEITFGFDLNEKLLSGELSDTDSSVIVQDLIVITNNNVDLIAENNIKDSMCISGDKSETVDSFTNSLIKNKKSSTDNIVNKMKYNSIMKSDDAKSVNSAINDIESNAKRNKVVEESIVPATVCAGSKTNDFKTDSNSVKLNDNVVYEQLDGTKKAIADIPLKFVPPKSSVTINKLDHDKIVQYVEIAWEDVIKCGEAQYFAGQ